MHRHRTFADEWLRTFNATKAAQKAGYSEKTAAVQGSRLLRNAKVEAYLAGQLRQAQIAPDEILARLSAQARAVLTDCIGPDGKFDLERVKALGPLVKSYRPPTATCAAQVELYDAQRALELIGKAHKLFGNDSAQANFTVPIQFNVSVSGDCV
jgi:phage terminase small subunit